MARAKADPAAEKRRMKRVIALLKDEYPEARCALDWETPFQLLAATILSAQCTDVQVNKTTPALFERFPDARAMARADVREVEGLIRSIGFFRMKALSLVTMSKSLVENHGGEVPRTIEELTALRGVGRKTANVVLGDAFGIQMGIVVDTHVGRNSRRLGFARQADPVKVERELMEIVPREDWTVYSHLLILHGRAVCKARRADCESCAVRTYCPKIGV